MKDVRPHAIRKAGGPAPVPEWDQFVEKVLELRTKQSPYQPHHAAKGKLNDYLPGGKKWVGHD